MSQELEGIGDRLREERTKAGLSQWELARRLGLSASLISQLEKGVSKPSVGTLYAIVTELDLIRAIRAGRDLEVTLAAEIMTSDVITVDAEEDIETVMETLDTEQIIRVPVTSDGRLVGVVARGDVIRAMLTPRFVLMG